MADRHYATDVMTGAVLGFGIGLAVPTLLHFDGGTGARLHVGAAVPGARMGLTVGGDL